MTKFSFIFFVFLSVHSFGQKKLNSSKNNFDKSVYHSMDTVADSFLKKSGANSVSIAIVKNKKTYIKHYGELDKGKGNKATNQTLFEIGSTTKIFTGTLMANAVLENKIGLDDDIRKYLNEDFSNLEFQGNPIKIKDLLVHRSGIQTPFPVTQQIRDKYPAERFLYYKNRLDKAYTKELFLADLRKVKVDSLPGTGYKYGALAPELCAYILENVYKKSYNDLLNEEIFKKAGMKSTKLNLENNEILANGYNAKGDTMEPLTISIWGASKFLKSTMDDLSKFIKFELNSNNKVIIESHRKVYSNINMGYFWDTIADDNGNTNYIKDGGSNGISNVLKILPKYNLGILIIANQNDRNTGTNIEDALNKLEITLKEN
ncbi:CubicO group peptidase (beta-lactamase class C family) [Chryseobacterium ginsenosidimutans]|uniref:serine hydrolase domain-containing protein n=1 Tax=Chryseobacterium ginsenosidimutans TaxID=687846 RepID=UPI002166F3F1|nr:serine hydrolase domain-containing protein [Chryseobacterium ginsenosidimutans]MCS3867264.1 CubicO group peptidase (beta-lactamase class C family) [Chryseobacterium ginsenosidimutans]